MNGVSIAFRVLELAALVWAGLRARLAMFIWLWMRERYGRGGPFPAKDALSLLNPLRGIIRPANVTVSGFRLCEEQRVLEFGPGRLIVAQYASISRSRSSLMPK